MVYDAELVRLVDERVRAGLPSRSTRMGTMVTRDGQACTVVFDGSAIATPVRVAGHVEAQPGDRVGLAQFEGEWVAVGGLSTPAAPAPPPSLEAVTVTPAQSVPASTVTGVSWQAASENVGGFGNPSALEFTVPAAGFYTATFQGLVGNGQSGRAFAQVLMGPSGNLRGYRGAFGAAGESGFSATGQRRLAVGGIVKAEIFCATATTVQPSTLVIYQIGL